MNIRIYISIVLLVIFVVASIGFFKQSNEELDRHNISDQDIKFREMAGFTTDLSTIGEIAKNATNLSKEIYGVALSDEEFAELQFREEISKATEAIKEAVWRTDIEGFSGLYIDQQTGTVNVGIVKGYESSMDKIKELYAYPDRLRFFEANFSLSELKSKKELLDIEHEQLLARGIPLISWSISPKENKVIVSVHKDAEPRQIDEIKQFVGADFVHVIQTESDVRFLGNR